MKQTMPLNWWTTQAHLMDKYDFLKDVLQFIDSVELTPLRIEGTSLKNCEYHRNDPNPNAYGVYLRYNDEGVDNFELNPSEWIADFETEKDAKAFHQLISTFVQAMKEVRQYNQSF
jgi:hypothetical protein